MAAKVKRIGLPQTMIGDRARNTVQLPRMAGRAVNQHHDRRFSICKRIATERHATGVGELEHLYIG